MLKYSHQLMIDATAGMTAKKLQQGFHERGLYVALNTVYLWKNGEKEIIKTKHLTTLADILGTGILAFFVSCEPSDSVLYSNITAGSGDRSPCTKTGSILNE